MRLLLLTLVALLPACNSLPDPGALAARPSDFVLAATVYLPPEAPTPRARARRPARYILEADLRLRTATGRGADEQTYPPPTRTLTRAQADRVWELLRDSGLLEPGNPYLRPSPASGAEGDAPAAGLFVTYSGGRAHLLVPLDAADAESIAAERLIDELAARSWLD